MKRYSGKGGYWSKEMPILLWVVFPLSIMSACFYPAFELAGKIDEGKGEI
jgi:hypothetical protein